MATTATLPSAHPARSQFASDDTPEIESTSHEFEAYTGKRPRGNDFGRGDSVYLGKGCGCGRTGRAMTKVEFQSAAKNLNVIFNSSSLPWNIHPWLRRLREITTSPSTVRSTEFRDKEFGRWRGDFELEEAYPNGWGKVSNSVTWGWVTTNILKVLMKDGGLYDMVDAGDMITGASFESMSIRGGRVGHLDIGRSLEERGPETWPVLYDTRQAWVERSALVCRAHVEGNDACWELPLRWKFETPEFPVVVSRLYA
ncbi:hypothetical protein BU17DRAFT_65634 [Hysterangium stoloniferum]|nr:hypothetical protein BU17DRAFT_65634 [Hysterangium stoloniferum]